MPQSFQRGLWHRVPESILPHWDRKGLGALSINTPPHPPAPRAWPTLGKQFQSKYSAPFQTLSRSE